MGPEVALVRPEVNSMVPEITKNAKTRHFSVFMQIFTDYFLIFFCLG